jgi:hypothetical protein
MIIVKENINFERGQEPLASMGIGKKILDKKIVEETEWDLPLDIIEQNFDIVSILRDLSQPVLILKSKSDGDGDGKRWVAVTTDYRTDYYDNAKDALGGLIGYLNVRAKTNESQNFTRYEDPKASLGIGKKVLIEKWLHEKELYFYNLNEDLTIDYSDKKNGAVVNLEGKVEGGELPSYIQFNVVWGGFNISKNRLTTLRGCPIKVKGTANYKGNFKCFDNELMTLEHAPKLIEGNFIAYKNPGNFTRGDVTKVCKVLSKTIWVDTKKTNEGVNFERDAEPLEKLEVGEHYQIKSWFKSMGIPETEYKINPDETIDAFDDINIVGKGLSELPEFINFNLVKGGFYAANNSFESLRGFPKEVRGDFSIYGGPKKWKDWQIRATIKVLGNLYN